MTMFVPLVPAKVASATLRPSDAAMLATGKRCNLARAGNFAALVDPTGERLDLPCRWEPALV